MVRSWMSIGGPAFLYKNGIRFNIKRNAGSHSAFHRIAGGLDAVCDRFWSSPSGAVQIENRDALELIALYNRPNVLMYLDPPYMLSARKQAKRYYNEYSDSNHEKLLDAIVTSKAKVIISGYDSELYRSRLSSWHTAGKLCSDEGNNLRTECIWYNYNSVQLSLFAEPEPTASLSKAG